MSVNRKLSRVRVLFAAAASQVVLLSGCNGPAPPLPPSLPVTATTQNVGGTWTRGQDIAFTYTVTNSSDATVPNLTVSLGKDSPLLGFDYPFQSRSISCSAQGSATCPETTSSSIGATTLAPHGTLVFTVTLTVAIDYEGAVTQSLAFSSPAYTGYARAEAVTHLADTRDGSYQIFSPAGRLANVAVHFNAGAMNFQVSTENAPLSFQPSGAYYLFADDTYMVAAPDLLVGNHDFGAGKEPFIAARHMVDALAELDGARFALFTADTPSNGAATTAVHAAWISGATLAVCMDAAPQTADTCPAGSQWQYALGQSGTVFTGVDGVHGDTVVFQVAKSGDSRYLLRAERAGTSGKFAVGIPSVAASGTPRFVGSVGGTWSAVRLGAGYASWPYHGATSVEPSVLALLQDVAGGPPGLQQADWTGGGDIVPVLAAHDATLAVQLVGSSELDLLALLPND